MTRPQGLEVTTRRRPRSHWHSISIDPSSYSFHFNHNQCCSCDLRTQIPFLVLPKFSSVWFFPHFLRTENRTDRIFSELNRTRIELVRTGSNRRTGRYCIQTFKLAGRVFAILRLRPTIDKEKLKPRDGLAEHKHTDLPSRLLSTSMVGFTAGGS